MKPLFNLTPELTDLILFAMENQDTFFLLDPGSLELVDEFDLREGESGDGTGLIPLPDWTSSDGYQLMESFAAHLRNPVYRERLREILNSRRGVFRKFKDVLKERPDLERSWYDYKHRGMVKVIRRWYNLLCDSWGAEALGEEPEETQDLFVDEFTVRSISAGAPVLEEARRAWEGEVYGGTEAGLKRLFLECAPYMEGDENAPDVIALEALSPRGESCGVVSFFLLSRGRGLYAWGDLLYVKPEFRGAGLASGLLDEVLRLCTEKGVDSLFLFLPPEGEAMKENLKRRGFRTAGPFLLLEVQKQNR